VKVWLALLVVGLSFDAVRKFVLGAGWSYWVPGELIYWGVVALVFVWATQRIYTRARG
jgi:hypothetical protein